MNDAANHLAALLKEATANKAQVIAVVAGVTVTVHPEGAPQTAAQPTISGSDTVLHLGAWKTAPAEIHAKLKLAVEQANKIGKMCALMQVEDLSIFVCETNPAPAQSAVKSKSKAPAHPKRDRSTFSLN
jgi:hypothetical protein